MELINYELNGEKNSWMVIKTARYMDNKVNGASLSVIQRNW